MILQRVRTDNGWHGRIRASGNNETVWTTEVYTDPAHVTRAIELLAETFATAPSFSYTVAAMVEVDERTTPHE